MTAHEACILKNSASMGVDNTVCTVSNTSTFPWHTAIRGRVVALDVTLERRIRELCAQAVAAQDADELQSIISELQGALHKHSDLLTIMLSEYPFLVRDLNEHAA